MKKNILLLFVLLFVSSCMERKYDILTAPPATGPIADYERIFTKEQRKTLTEIDDRVYDKYGVQIYFLSVKSFYQDKLGFDMTSKLIYEILGLNHLTDAEMKKTKNVIFLFSHHDRYNAVETSLMFRQMVDKKSWDERRYPYIVKYFPEHKYYEAFKAMFEITEDELRKYKEKNLI